MHDQKEKPYSKRRGLTRKIISNAHRHSTIKPKEECLPPFCDVTTNILNQESTQNCYEESNEGNSHTYADHTISLRQNLLQKFHIVSSRETIQSHSYLYRGTSSQQNAIPQTESSISEPLEENANTLSDDVTEGSNDSDGINDPDEPDNPDDPDGPDDPKDPDGPDDPNGPDNPNGPENTNRLDDANGPDDPNGPNDPDGPDDPDGQVQIVGPNQVVGHVRIVGPVWVVRYVKVIRPV
ncbi:thrombospondin-related anonymous protein [Vigna unguiculata]|uniref:Thrombospondin-related anonymous protein n=1 Tax=Vigna unguiculata TaxID=3917 RepID=A0A4D6KXV8_VIGUN|nr:thrombospondin-related anonymous protein [Vigna unguiculata]